MERDDDFAIEARTLIRRARRGALATLEPGSGAPYASLAAVATAADGAPLFLLSDLARHTANLRADSRVALLVEDAGQPDPLAAGRVTLSGVIVQADDSPNRSRYLARHASSAAFADFGDFHLWRLEPEAAHLVAGFGRIRTFQREQVVTNVSDAAALLEAEAEAIAHMNSDHADTLKLYATRLLGGEPGALRADGLDPEGLEISCGDRVLYLRFPERVRDPMQLRHALISLAQKARG